MLLLLIFLLRFLLLLLLLKKRKLKLNYTAIPVSNDLPVSNFIDLHHLSREMFKEALERGPLTMESIPVFLKVTKRLVFVVGHKTMLERLKW